MTSRLMLVGCTISVHSCPCKLNGTVFPQALSTPNRVCCSRNDQIWWKVFSLLDPLPEQSPLFLLLFELIQL